MPSALVVDDERIVTRDLEESLTQLGYDVVGTASSGQEAVDKAKELIPDLILMDIMMPGEKDGIEAAVEIRDELNIPIVFLTAYADVEVLERAKGAAPCGYIVKPFQSQQLRAAVDMALHEAMLQNKLTESNEALNTTVRQLESDVAERKRAENELLKANRGLKEAYEDLERAQEQLIRSEKLAALGRLTAGVSHEVLNPLNIITMSLHLMLGDPETPPNIAEQLEILKEQAFRINKITQNLLYFARQMGPERRSVDINEAIEATLSLIEHDLKHKGVDVEADLAEELPPVYADRGQLQQVVLNLLNNASDAMVEGGRLRLRTYAVQEDGEQYVELRVEDTGPGIAPEHLDKVFDPFFTTKAEGDGTGLGLSICEGIVEAHEGKIWAEIVPEGGAVFVVKLSTGLVESPAGKVLVVDDEPSHCEMMRKFLLSKGYSVMEANDGDGALELYKQERPDVVFLDIRMPGKDGLETLREIRAFDPETKVIMLTAIPDQNLGRQARAEGALEYITKPVNLVYLEAALVTTIGMPGGGG